MSFEVLGFLDSEFIPWPDDFRDEDRFSTWGEQFRAAEFQPNLLDYTGGGRMVRPSQALLPEGWNRSGVPDRYWRPVPDDPRVEDVRGAIFAPAVVLRERLPAALRRASEHPGRDAEAAAAMLLRIVDLATEAEEQGRRLLLVVSP